jgi:hypothetical protein
MDNESVEVIASIVANTQLSTSLVNSIERALARPSVHMKGGATPLEVFRHSLNVAIRDIEAHPLGKLFQRLIEFGPHNPEDPPATTSDGKTTLSDPECEVCVEFIFSHMINRFKGELAELLAVEPTIELVENLKAREILPSDIQIYWGDTIRERRLKHGLSPDTGPQWQSMAKGADGLLVQHADKELLTVHDLRIVGVVEVKSMHVPRANIDQQIDSHISRMAGGVMLGERAWHAKEVKYGLLISDTGEVPDIHRLFILPSGCKLSRDWHYVDNQLLPSETESRPGPNITQQLDQSFWRIKLGWSQEALNQAAYEMTFWYMSQVGRTIYESKTMPKGWEEMTPEEAGRNSIKMMLYYMPLRNLALRQERLAIRLYNVYSFGFPLGVDSKEMLWPKDIT